MKEVFTVDEKIARVDRLIIEQHKAGGNKGREAILKAISADLRARKYGAPSAAYDALEMRIRSALRTKAQNGDFETSKLVALAQELLAKWPVVSQALERFGPEIEKPCILEARPLPLGPSIHGTFGTWCQTHGWNCPNNSGLK